MENRQNQLDQYLAKVAYLLDNGRESECTEEALRKIAKELGLTTTEWELIEQEFEEYCVRAENYIKYQQYERAVAQCTSALQIKPLDKRALILISKAALQLWKETKLPENLDNTVYYAEKLIYYYPSDNEAYTILQQTKRKPLLNTIIAVVALLVLGITTLFYFLRPSETVPMKTVQKKQELISASADSMLLLSQTDWKLYSSGFDTSAFDFKIFDAQLEKYNAQSMSIKCLADIYIKNFEMHELEFDIQVFDANSKLLNTLRESVLHYQPAALPGDVMPFDFLFYDSVMPAFPLTVKIVPVKIKKRPIAEHYVQAKEIVVKNADDFLSYQLKISERRSIYEVQELMNQTTHKLSLLIENTGKNDISKLRLKIIWTLDGEKQISEKNIWVNISDMPPIQAGQRRFFFTIETFNFKKTTEKLDYSILFEQIE